MPRVGQLHLCLPRLMYKFGPQVLLLGTHSLLRRLRGTEVVWNDPIGTQILAVFERRAGYGPPLLLDHPRGLLRRPTVRRDQSIPRHVFQLQINTEIYRVGHIYAPLAGHAPAARQIFGSLW